MVQHSHIHTNTHAGTYEHTHTQRVILSTAQTQMLTERYYWYEFGHVGVGIYYVCMIAWFVSPDVHGILNSVFNDAWSFNKHQLDDLLYSIQ